MLNLVNKKCVVCEFGGLSLPKETITTLLGEIHTGWTLSGDEKRLTHIFRFHDFKEAMEFVNRVAALAEAEGHHPDMKISWNKVTLELTTHAVGGLSENDFILASKIELL